MFKISFKSPLFDKWFSSSVDEKELVQVLDVTLNNYSDVVIIRKFDDKEDK